MNLSRMLLGLFLGLRRPRTAGTLTVTGLRESLTIRRTKYGVPCIEAANDADAAFGIGFCHAQDRGFQLETYLRIVRGTFAAMVGPEALPVDRLSRRIGFHRAALKQWPVLAPDVQDVIRAYVAGVNAGFSQGLKSPPHEFALLKCKPSVWEAADVIGYLKLQSFMLPSNWDLEIARLKVLRADGPDALKALDPAIGEAMPSHLRDSAAIDALLNDLALFQKHVPTGGGSNNWTIHGSKTATGKPILSNDPHLAPTLPAPWYLVQIRTPEWAAAGATFAGAPALPVGHNGQCAWGVTAGLIDNCDLFLETIGPDGTSVRRSDGSFEPCELVRETIEVKGQPSVIEEVLITPRGPVVSPLFRGVTDAVSLSAVWLQPLPLRGFLGVMRANSFEQFRAQFAEWPALPLNVVYADADGTIGYQLVGQIPKRRSNLGTIPMPGDSPDAGWDGLVPFDQMPYEVNPARGFVATANSNPLGPPVNQTSRGAFLGVDYCDHYRASIILDELAKANDWSVEKCFELQTSQRSMVWEEMNPVLQSLNFSDASAREARDLLMAWDGIAAADSPAAGLFALFMADLAIRVAQAKAPKSWGILVGGSDSDGLLGHSLFGERRMAHTIHLVRTRPAGWFAQGWDHAVEASLIATVQRLRKEAGPSPDYWGWGHLRPLVLAHPVLGKQRFLKSIFNIGPIPFGGDGNTVLQAGGRPRDITAPVTFLPNLRTAFDTSDWSKSRFVLAGGQSGNPCSPHFDDLFPLWLQGQGVPIPYTREDVIRDAVATLRLEKGTG